MPEAAIPEEDERDWENSDSASPGHDGPTISPLSEELEQAFQTRPALRRAASHESVMSFAGMDVHTLKSRPSQLLTPYGARSYAPQVVVSDTTAHAARPAALYGSSNTGASILNGIAPTQRSSSGHLQTPKQGLGSKVGGWVFGRWGASPAPLSISPDGTVAKMGRAVSVTSASTDKSVDDPQATPKKPKLRPPGINQSGPILGFGPEMRIQHAPILKQFDADALKKVLGD